MLGQPGFSAEAGRLVVDVAGHLSGAVLLLDPATRVVMRVPVPLAVAERLGALVMGVA